MTSASPALANNYGEDPSWQFQTPTDQADLAGVQDLIQKKQAGEYQAPVYNTTTNYNYNDNSSTNIAHQTNCSVASTVYGNYGSESGTGISPSSTGPGLSAWGNQSASSVDQEGVSNLPVNLSTGQTNTGQVSTNYLGNTSSVAASGTVSQSLNSTQKNGGTQSASVNGSTACSGALN